MNENGANVDISQSESPASGPRKAAITFILLTLFIDILGIGIVIPVLPPLIQQFVGGSTADAGWYVGVISATYSLALFLFAPVLGALSDRYGRRPVLLAALFGLGIDFLVQGLATNITWLFFGRLISGIMGASFSTAYAYIADVSTDENRAQNYGLAGVMFGLGFIIGPALGGWLGSSDVPLGSWFGTGHLQRPFFVSAALALINWLYGYFVLPESLPPEKRSSFSWSSLNPFASLKVLAKYPIVFSLALPFVCASLAQRGLENVWVLFTGFILNWDEAQNGFGLCLVGVMALIVQGGLVRPAIKYFGERRIVAYGLAVSTITFCGYGLSTEDWMVYAFIVFGSLGGIYQPAMQSIVASSVNAHDQGKVQGGLTSLTSLTSVFAPLLFTTGLFSYFTSPSREFPLAGAPFIAGSVMIFSALLLVHRVFGKFPTEGEAVTGANGPPPSKKPMTSVEVAVAEAD